MGAFVLLMFVINTMHNTISDDMAAAPEKIKPSNA